MAVSRGSLVSSRPRHAEKISLSCRFRGPLFDQTGKQPDYVEERVMQNLEAGPAEREIRVLFKAWERAVQRSDLDSVMTHYLPDLVVFDAIGELRYEGLPAYRSHWQRCLEMCPGALVFEIHELAIKAGQDMAWAHYLTRCGAVDAEGEEKASWMRASVCLRREKGDWKIAHEHFSVPFDPLTGKTSFDLTP